MEKKCLNLVMVGKTGSGNSSTGNTILGRTVFRASASCESVTETVSGAWGEFQGQEILIVDCPGLYSTRKTDNEDFQATYRNIEHALRMCNSSITSFLITLMWSTRLQCEVKQLMERLTEFFVDDFYNHVIIVITEGDKFSAESDVTFHEWCRQQTGPLADLFQACEYRVVLLNNRNKETQENKNQIKSIMEVAKSLPPYTKENWFACSNAASPTSTASSTQKGKPKKKELRFLMVGTTGAGKSATANSLVQRYVFDTSSDAKSQTKKVTSYNSKFKNYKILVVDGPGFNDTDISIEGMGVVQVNNALKIAIAKCYGGVDAFLMVMKITDKYTSEQKLVIDSLTKIFGAEFTKNLIVILSFGDTRPELANDADFQNWCKAQTGGFHTLYEKCGGRFIIVNNKEKDQMNKERKLDEILQLADTLQSLHGRYTTANFANAEQERIRYVAKCHAPMLEKKIQEQLSYLLNDIDENNMKNLRETKTEVSKRVRKLTKTIKKADNKSGVLKELMSKLAEVEENLTNMSKLCKLRKELEEIRSSKASWIEVGKKVIIGLAIPIATLPVAGIAGAVTGFGALHYGNKESATEKLVLEQESKTNNRKESVKKWMSPENTN